MKQTNRSILFFILTAATILRCYDLFNIPMTHDEFSALFRLRFDSFSELIEKGVKVDGHPAGIHILLYYWTSIFGTSPWVFKVPFIIFGILSSLLSYLIAKKWFNETVGLITASYLASIQFTVMYSQIGRPYISGLFFCLLLVYFWSNLVKNPYRKFYTNGVFFVLSAALCAYNHHFSLLFAVIISIAGLFYLPKNKIVPYLLFGVGIFLLYIPHLPIFFFQLSIGGLGGVDGWLSVPKYDFLPNFIHYLFNYSTLSILIAFAILLFGLKQNNFKITFSKKYILFSALFLIPFLIGFYYSRLVNPVLQFSMLIFSFPFFYFILFGHLKNQKTTANAIIVGSIIIANTFSLIWNRQHYSIFYNSVYAHVLTDHKEFEEMPRIIESNPRFTAYFIDNQDIDTNFFRYESFKDIADFKDFVADISQKNDELYFGSYSSSDPRLVPIILEYFPKIKHQKNYFLGSSYVFSKKITRGLGIQSTITQHFEGKSAKKWNVLPSSRIIDTASFSGKKSFSFDTEIEYGLVFTANLVDLAPNPNNYIDISIQAKSKKELEDILIVAQINNKDGEQIHWSGADFNNFHSTKGQWNTFYHSIKFSDVYLSSPREDCTLKILIWNKGKKEFLVDDFTISVRYGNPILYGLYKKV